MNECILEVDFPMRVHKQLNTHWGAALRNFIPNVFQNYLKDK